MTIDHPTPNRSARAARAAILREITRGGLAGIITGMVFGGVGGRLAMRLSFLIDPSARGVVTEGGNRVGEFTLEGTLALIIFIGLFSGISAGFLLVLVRRWMPARLPARAAVGSMIGVAAGARLAIEGRNFDFRILEPPLGQAVIFIGLAAAAGAGIIAIDDWLDRRLPHPRGRGLWGYATFAGAGLLLTAPLGFGLASEGTCDCASPPRVPGVLTLALGILLLVTWIFEARGREVPALVPSVGRWVLSALIVFGLFHLGGEIAHFV